MKGLAWRLLAGLLIAALSACTGAATPSPSPSPPHSPAASVAVGSAASTAGLASPASPSATPSAALSATPSVVAVVTGYYRAIVSRTYRRAFGYLAPGATGPDGKLTLRSFVQLAQMLDGMGGPVTQFSIGGFPAEVVMTLSRAKYGPYHAHLQMARTSHGWAITSIDRI